MTDTKPRSLADLKAAAIEEIATVHARRQAALERVAAYAEALSPQWSAQIGIPTAHQITRADLLDVLALARGAL